MEKPLEIIKARKEKKKEVCRLFDIAIRDEKEGIEFYSKMAEKLGDRNLAKAFIKSLQRDEEKHAESLEKMKGIFC